MKDPDTGEFKGFCIDLLKKLQEMMGFTYDLYEVEDGILGTQKDNGMWDGIVGDIVEEVSYG